MLKKIFYSLISLLLISTMSFSVFAKTKECLVKPNYNIVVNDSYALISLPDEDLRISAAGVIAISGTVKKTRPAITKEAKAFYAYLNQQYPALANRGDIVLGDLRNAFTEAIIANLGTGSKLIGSVDNLYIELRDLLHKSIKTQDGQTYFHHEAFNNFRADSEAVSKKMMYDALGDSIFSFSIFKNYSTLKQISKQEWKEQKVFLKAFQDEACDVVTETDNQLNHLKIGLTY